MYQKILVPIDGSIHSHHTLEQAVRLAGFMGPGCRLRVLHVSAYVLVGDAALVVDPARVQEEEGKAILAAAAPLLKDAPFAHDEVYTAGDPAETICRMAEDEGFDLIVIGNRGRGLFSELLMGSVSHKILQHASCPVLLIR
jgi:nucleotide-binding universal stress UspA family protein